MFHQSPSDSVMTIAVAEALMDTMGKSDEEIKAAIDSRLEDGYFTVIVFDRSYI